MTKRLNNKGFAALMILSLLPALVGGLLIVTTLMGFMQWDLALKHTCRVGGLEGQNAVKSHLTSLLKLNPLAQSLKIQEIAAQVKLKAALSSGQPVAIAAAMNRLSKIQGKRRELDIRQKQLIQQSNLVLQRNHLQTRIELSKKSQELLKTLTFLKVSIRMPPEKSPKLAVRPDFPDVAPTYSPEQNFEVRQALAHRWQYRLSLREPLRKFLNADFGFEKACAVTLTQENLIWRTQITRGKYSLKSVW